MQSPYLEGQVDTGSCPDESVHHISVALLTGNVEWSRAHLYDRDNDYELGNNISFHSEFVRFWEGPL